MQGDQCVAGVRVSDWRVGVWIGCGLVSRMQQGRRIGANQKPMERDGQDGE